MADFQYHLERLLCQIKYKTCLYAICNKIPLITPQNEILKASFVFYKHLKDNQISYDEVKFDEGNLEFLTELETLIKPTHIVIILVGCPGSGKTTLGKRLAEHFGGLYLDQDMFKTQAKQYHGAINQAIMEDRKLIILGKSHHTYNVRGHLYKVLPDNYFRLFIEFSADKEVCLSRIQNRKNHQNLKSDNPDLEKIITNFVDSMQRVSDQESLMGYKLSLNVTESVEQWMEKVQSLGFLSVCDESENFKYSYRKLKTKKALYYAIDVDMSSILNHLLVKEYLEEYPIILQEKFHLTLRYFGKNGYPGVERFYQNMVGENKDVICLGIFCDDKGLCVLCTGDFSCSNEYAHITLGNSEGVRPVYSNELCEKGELIKFETPIIVQGVISAKY